MTDWLTDYTSNLLILHYFYFFLDYMSIKIKEIKKFIRFSDKKLMHATFSTHVLLYIVIFLIFTTVLLKLCLLFFQLSLSFLLLVCSCLDPSSLSLQLLQLLFLLHFCKNISSLYIISLHLLSKIFFNFILHINLSL